MALMLGKRDRLLAEMVNNPADVRFVEAIKLAESYFGPPRISGSHHIFKTPWAGMPRVNIQKEKNGKTNRYQIIQLLEAIEKAGTIAADTAQTTGQEPANTPKPKRRARK
jgi:hypothetical protein